MGAFYDSAEGGVREQYIIPSQAFGAGTVTKTIKGPKGKRGIVRDILVELTANAVGTTTVPEVTVGTGSADFSYARFRLGTAVGAGYAAATYRARNLAGGNGLTPTLEDFTGHVKLETALIAADATVVISGVAGVGGAPAGTGVITVTIDWF